jgi:hypothetical protein
MMIVSILPFLSVTVRGIMVTLTVLEVPQEGQNSIDVVLSIHFIVTPDVEENYFLFFDHDRHGEPVTVGNADCLDTG